MGVSQGCVDKILRLNRQQGRPDQRKMSTPHEDSHLLHMARVNRFISSHLRMHMIRHFGRNMTARTVRNRILPPGYRSQHPTRCPRLL